mgnify:CR=1 FL=1
MPSTSILYRLRGGQINPALSSCTGTGVPDYFYIQTFGAERIVTDFDDAKIAILASDDMQGQKPGDHDDPTYRATTYASASYSSRPLRTTDGDLVWNAQEIHVAEFIDEEDVGT